MEEAVAICAPTRERSSQKNGVAPRNMEIVVMLGRVMLVLSEVSDGQLAARSHMNNVLLAVLQMK